MSEVSQARVDAAGGAHEAQSAGAFARVLQVGREAHSGPGFFRAALAVVGESFASPYAQIYVRFPSEIVHEEYHQGPTDPRFWKGVLEDFLTHTLSEGRARARLFGARQADTRIALIAAPLFDRSGTPIGAVAVVTPQTHDDAWQRVAYLEALAALMSHVSWLVGQAPARAEAAARDSAPSAALARAASIQSTEELAFSLTNSLRVKLGCDQVALALVERRSVRILSISGHDEVVGASPGVSRIRAAMEECLDVGAPLAFAAGGGWVADGASADYRLHQRWHEAAHGASVASIPLRSGEGWGAVLSLRRGADKPFLPDDLTAVRAAVEPYAPALLLTRRANRSLVRHAVDAATGSVSGLLAPGRRGRKLLTLLGVVFAGWFCFGTMDYEVAARCTLKPAEGRTIAAPVDGRLAASYVVAGDAVRAGDLLLEFDHGDLTLERGRLTAELHVALAEHESALAAGKPVEARLAVSRAELAQAKLEIVVARIERSRVRSPIDGVVVAGDLRSQVGSIVPRGATLLELAPPGRWILEIEVPDAEAAAVRPAMSGRFASLARPEDARRFELARVRPTAEVRAGANVFIAEAALDVEGDWVRAGAEGTARIEVGPRRVWWVSLHRPIEYLWVNFWL